MAKYCCFCCPEFTHDNNRQDDTLCPTCNNPYGFPLKFAPKKIGKYEIVEALRRGFYGAVYKVNDDLLGKEYVLKVIPQEIYKLHNKDFYAECKAHADLAKKSPNIVGIHSAETATVEFTNGITIDCFVAVLDYIPGPVLKDILEGPELLNATKVAQIAIDLLRILDVLRQKQKNHNDLHYENLIVETLPTTLRRTGEIEDTTRVVAIDIGSLTSDNRSGDSPDRKSDVHWVAEYLIKLSEKLISNPDKVGDQNYRLASLLEDRAKLLFPQSEYLRSPNFDEVMESIRNCFTMQAFPWEEPLKLLNFNDTYNAQTLDPWYVPTLLVDPDDQWLKRICAKGPLVITGMRGCGKTMMLRALQFHARAALAKTQFRGVNDDIVKKLNNDGYVGIYVSCNKLLDEMGKSADEPLHHPYSRLFIRYGIEALKALRHLHSITGTLVKNQYYRDFVQLYKSHLASSDILEDVYSELQLEQKLLHMIYSLNKGDDKYVVQANPSNSFPALAQVIRNSSTLWSNHYILFLLDDVSTRYLGEENIKTLLSSLIFQSEDCAFKITSEIQTIELVLYSPGKVEKAKRGRDFETFDLGSAVNDKIRNKGGKKFVADILQRRAEGSIKHPQKKPFELLGDSTLNAIAKSIVTRGDDKTIKKRIYHGLTSLAGVCIGDIGDMINLYDLIIKKYDPDKQIVPIPAELQNECFQDLCSIRLHEINRRGSTYKDFALSFAEASFELLMKSAKEGGERLRQYYSIYIRITTGDTEKQYEKIRQLLDAGIFVYSGGASTPRTLGNDTNPISQFKLTYRKLYGLSKLIGLTNGDRFELSGEQTEEWLNNPANGKEILMKNVGGAGSNVDEGDELDSEIIVADEKATQKMQKIKQNKSARQSEFGFPIQSENSDDYYESEEVKKIIKEKTPNCEEIPFEHLKQTKFDYLICALGFEDRTLFSVKKLLELKIEKIFLIQYDEIGKSDEIMEEVTKSGIKYEIATYEMMKNTFAQTSGNILCDITGMSKSLIFNIVRNGLKQNKKIWISHVHAEQYYPLNEEIEAVLNEYKEENNYNILDIITEKILKGEILTGEEPFEIQNLLLSDTDDSKRNLLVGFSSAKYERLFKILENRQFDRIEVMASRGKSPRDSLSRLAAEITAKTYSNAEPVIIDKNDICSALDHLAVIYQKFYIDRNFNFEIALTGSKRQAVACAAISATFKISHCWYVKPKKWDVDRFSKGIGKQTYFTINIK